MGRRRGFLRPIPRPLAPSVPPLNGATSRTSHKEGRGASTFPDMRFCNRFRHIDVAGLRQRREDWHIKTSSGQALYTQLIRPNYDKPVGCEDINIQELLALCKACGNVFDFFAERSRIWRRKLKRPA